MSLNIRRILVRVFADPTPSTGWCVEICPDGGAAVATRVMRCGKISLKPHDLKPSKLPWPPAAAGAAEEPEPATVDALAERCKRIAARQRLEADDVEEVGRALFAALLGNELWQTIRQLAENVSVLELALALQWDPEATALHRLNWELLHGPEGFLAAGFQNAAGQFVRVALTRVIEQDKSRARPITKAARMLFVVGSELNDTAVRAGAEYFALLRQFEMKERPRAFVSRVLLRASPSRLEAMVREFQPDILHFVGHGELLPDGQAALRLQPEEGATEAEKKDTALHRRTADQLVSLWTTADGHLPSVVILSACQSATAGEARSVAPAAPLAAALVAAGIPVVVGMAGRVTDLACRLFTRFFGEALLLGQPLVLAAEAGRRGAFDKGQQPKLSADWALPTLHLAKALPSACTITSAAETKDEERDRIVATGLRRRRELRVDPPFAARFECLDQPYRAWLWARNPEKPVMVLVGRDNVGKTRVLEELAVQAALDGHFPVLVVPPEIGAEPGTYAGWTKVLFEAVQQSMCLFDLSPLPDAKLPPLLGWAGYDKRALDRSKTISEEPMEVILAALRWDVQKFAEALRQRVPPNAKTQTQPFLLFGRLERSPRALLEHFSGDAVNGLSSGFGPLDSGIVRVAISFRSGTEAWPGLLEKLGAGGEPAWMQRILLEHLSHTNEDLEAAGRLLLHLNRFAGTKMKKEFQVPLVFRPDLKETEIDDWRQALRDTVAELPGEFTSDSFFVWVRTSLGPYLRKADDEALLKEYRPWQVV